MIKFIFFLSAFDHFLSFHRLILLSYCLFLCRFGRFLSTFMHDIDLRYDNVISEFLNNTGVFENLPNQIALVKNFTQVFTNGNGSLEALLLEAGLHQSVVDLILDGYININRVSKTINYICSQKLFSKICSDYLA